MTSNFSLIAFIFYCLGAHSVTAQKFSYDEFLNEQNPDRRFEMGVVSWNYFLRNDLDSLRIIGNELIKSNIIPYFELKYSAIGKRNLGSYYIRTTNIKKGIDYLERAKQHFTKLNLKILISETENELGNAYYLLGDYGEATIHYLASIENGVETSDPTAEYNGLIGFGKATCAAGDTSAGLLFVQKYLERALKDEKFEAAADACGFLGMIAGERGQMSLMSAYYNRGIMYARKSDSKTHRANALNNKAIDYYYHDKADSTEFYFIQALRIREEIGNTRPIIESLYNLAVFHIEDGQFDIARDYAERGEMLANNAQMRSSQIECLVLMLEIANKTSKFSEVSKLKLEIIRIQDELKKLGTVDDRIIQLAMKYASPKIKDKEFDYSVLVAIFAIILTAALLLYQDRASSTSAGTQA